MNGMEYFDLWTVSESDYDPKDEVLRVLCNLIADFISRLMSGSEQPDFWLLDLWAKTYQVREAMIA